MESDIPPYSVHSNSPFDPSPPSLLVTGMRPVMPHDPQPRDLLPILMHSKEMHGLRFGGARPTSYFDIGTSKNGVGDTGGGCNTWDFDVRTIVASRTRCRADFRCGSIRAACRLEERIACLCRSRGSLLRTPAAPSRSIFTLRSCVSGVRRISPFIFRDASSI
jgi:hypothetical protein